MAGLAAISCRSRRSRSSANARTEPGSSHRLTCECRSKPRGTAAFRRQRAVSVSGIGPRKMSFRPLRNDARTPGLATSGFWKLNDLIDAVDRRLPLARQDKAKRLIADIETW